MAYAGRSRRRLDARTEVGRLLALLGATGLAISQPVLDAFGNSPETFIFRHADSSDLVVFAFAIALVPSTVLWAFGVLTGIVQPRARRAVHAASVGLVIGLFIAQLASSWPWVLRAAMAMVIGMLCWVLVVRVSHVRFWLQLLAALPAISVLLFLVASRASDAVGAGSFEPALPGEGTGAPIVLIVLDELPTASLLGADGGIDGVRFPNIARLATEATWYRNATTTSGWTATAVPAIFSGQWPTNDSSIFTRRPDSIFRLLAGTHDLVVSEPTTRLCPLEACGATPMSPVGADAPVQVDGDLAGLFGDAVDLFVQRVSGVDTADLLAQFEEEVVVPVPPATTTAPWVTAGEELPASGEAAAAAQPERVRAFVEALNPGDRPLAAILHTVLPHHPWRFLPDGRRYEDPAEDSYLDELSSNGWIANVERQQHLLQVMYADRIVGQILDRIREVGVYDDAVVVLTADHGVAFPTGGFGRLLGPETEDDIMWVPLLVKAPGQRVARIDDANVQNIDVLPTIASLAGVEIPWAVDGAAVGSPAIAARGDVKRYYRLRSILERDEEVLDVDGRAGLRAMTTSGFPAITAQEDAARGLYRLAGRGDLIGTPLQTSADAAAGTLEIDDHDRLLDGDEPVLFVSGSVAGDADSDHVIAAVDGTIVAISPVYELGGKRRFLFILPASDPVELDRVELGIVEVTGSGDRIRRAGSLAG